MMQRQVVLSKSAEIKLTSLFEYLETNWSRNSKSKFISKLESKLQLIKEKLEIFPNSEIRL